MNQKQVNIFGTIVFLGLIFIFDSCRKTPVLNTDPNFSLEFSADTVKFDTVFTTMGSTTLWLKVYNRSDKDVDIRTIELMNGQASPFRMNVDGDTSLSLRNIRLRAKDSLFIFIKVTINPDDKNNPFEIFDSIRFSYNNRWQDVVLRVVGQNFTPHPINDTLYIPYGSTDSLLLPCSIADCSKPWTAEKPHVIYGYLLVNTGDELILEPGTRLHFAPDAGLIVAKGGSLKIRGEINREVILDGMRMDADYKNTTGQWNRVWLSPGSVNNEINWAIIRNGKIGLWIDTVANENPTLIIQNSIIDNMQNYGILSQSAVIRGENLQVSNCGERLLALTLGGSYDFKHCTFANYFQSSMSARKTSAVRLNNYAKYSDGTNSNTLLYPLINADFTSCIIYGTSSNELELDLSNQTLGNYNFSFCNISTATHAFPTCQINIDPYFKDPFNGNFDIVEPPTGKVSGVIAKGNPSTNILYDLKNRRRGYFPTIGAYEFTEQNSN